MDKPHVVIIGLGDTGILTAMQLAKYVKVTAIGTKSSFISGQELGLRLVEPEVWRQHYAFEFKQFRQLQAVNIIHGKATRIDYQLKQVHFDQSSGSTATITYDALVIASGVSNGFWRDDQLLDRPAIKAQFSQFRHYIVASDTIHVIGGGPSAVSAAFNIKRQYHNKTVKLFFSRDQVLPQYATKTRSTISKALDDIGVIQKPNHRAILGKQPTSLTQQIVHFEHADQIVEHEEALTLWAIGTSKPHNDFIPEAMLTPTGFVNVDQKLAVKGIAGIFSVGDIANSDPHRSSARNNGHRVVAKNTLAYLNGKKMKQHFVAPRNRWGSILGIQPTGLGVFSPSGRLYSVNRWITERILFPFFVRRVIYKGIKT